MTSTELPEPRSYGIDYTPVADYAGFVAYLGEGLHTGLRKAAESAAASRAHSAISQMSDREWASVIEFVAEPLWLAMQAGGLITPGPKGETEPVPARRTITLQPAMTGDRMPYPFHVNPDGTIGRQDFWSGKPSAVIGITDVPVPGRMTKVWTDVVDDIEQVLGTYLVVTDADGQWSTMGNHIESITERDGESVEHFERTPTPS